MGAVGIPDPSFRAGSGVDGIVTCIVPLPSGQAIIAGLFTRYNGVPRPGIALVAEDGSLESSFAPQISSPPGGGVATVVIDSQQRIYLGGHFTSVDGRPRAGLARVDLAGRLDPTFDPELPLGAVIAAIAFSADGGVFVGGSLQRVDSITGQSGLAVQKLRAEGRIDASFQAPPMQAYDNIPIVYKLVVLPDGRLLAAGEFRTVGINPERNNICRVRADGSIDPSYTASAPVVWTQINDIDLLADGRAYVSGDFGMLNDFEPGCVARLSPSGSAERTFKLPVSNSTGIHGPIVNSLLVLTDGRLLAGGNFRNANGTERNFLARVFDDGAVDTSFTAGTDNEVVTVAEDTQGRLWIGGAFTSLNGAPAPGVARILRTGDIPVVRGALTAPPALQGGNVILDPKIVGADSIQWLRNGTVVAGATDTSFAIASASAGDDGTYTFRATNRFGTFVSQSVPVTVVPFRAGALDPTLNSNREPFTPFWPRAAFADGSWAAVCVISVIDGLVSEVTDGRCDVGLSLFAINDG